MNFASKLVLVLACSGYLCCHVGCGRPEAKLVPATGTLTIDGKPTAGILVQFVPKTLDEAVVAPTSQAITDDAGKFDLFTTKNQRGAIEGVHVVTLVDTLEERPEQGQPMTRPPRIDPSFAAAGGLTAEVIEGQAINLEASGPK